MAGAGIAAFAVSAVGNLNKVTDAMDELEKVREDLQEARREGDQEAINEALAERARILGELNPAQTQLLRSIQDAKQAYEEFLDTTARPVSDALTAWIDLAQPAFELLEPLVTSTAEAVEYLALVAENMMTSPFWQEFADLLAENVGPLLEEFGWIMRDMLRGMAELLPVVLPFAHDLVDWLVDLFEAFSNWAKSPEGKEQVEGFMETAATLGPDIAEALGDITGGVTALLSAFAGDGIGALQIVADFFSWLAEGDNAERVKNALYGIAAATGAVAAAFVVMAIAAAPIYGIAIAVIALAGVIGYFFPQIRDWALGVGDTLTWVFTEKIPQGWNTFKNFFISSWDDFKNWWITQWENFRDNVVDTAGEIWDRIEQGWNTFKNFFLETVPKWGGDVIDGMKDGIDNAMSGIGNWLDKNVWQPIRDAVLGLFGIGSPSKKFAWFGNQMILGLIEGLGQGGWGSMIDKIFGGASDRAVQALGWLVSKGKVAMSDLADAGSWVWEKLGGLGGALGDLFGGGGDVGGGVARWSGLVSSVLGMLNQPQDLVDDVLQRINQESGGDPRAINRWDVNAMRGDPSRGLMQTIGSTFRAYAGQFAGRGIYDPLANVYAALRYSLDRYGSIARAMHQPGGYATGAWRIGSDQVATVHRGEMVLPQKLAERVRGALSERGDPSGPMVNVENLTVNPAREQPVGETVDEAMFALRSAARSGRANVKAVTVG